MVLEIVASLALGLLVLWLMLQPLLRPEAARPAFEEPEDPEETRRGIALIALKEIDFDRATGKLSDADYELLRAKYTGEALQALREAEPEPAADAIVERLVAERVAVLEAGAVSGGNGVPRCRHCGPRPEPDARFCSSCGTAIVAGPHCARCGSPLAPGNRFCGECGARC